MTNLAQGFSKKVVEEEKKIDEIPEEVKQEVTIQSISSYRESEYTDTNVNIDNNDRNKWNLKDMLQDSMNENLAESVYPIVADDSDDCPNKLSLPENQ